MDKENTAYSFFFQLPYIQRTVSDAKKSSYLSYIARKCLEALHDQIHHNNIYKSRDENHRTY